MVAMIDDDWPAFEYITGPGAGVGKDADPGFIESLSRYMRAAANPSAVHAYEKMNGQIDTRPILPSIQAPTLVMNRTGDPCANVEAARDMASRIPGAKFKEYPGNSHSMMLDDGNRAVRHSGIHNRRAPDRFLRSHPRYRALPRYCIFNRARSRAWRYAMAQSFELLLRHCAKGIGALPREGNQHHGRQFSRDLRRSGASGALRARNLLSRSDNSVSKYVRECTPANAN